MKNKYSEIKNKLYDIQNCVDELQGIIKEAEIAETLNTSDADDRTFMVDGTANEIEDEVGEMTTCGFGTKLLAGTGISLLLLILLLVAVQ
jgi:hypothetical protein